jgi:hypothetical protein
VFESRARASRHQKSENMSESMKPKINTAPAEPRPTQPLPCPALPCPALPCPALARRGYHPYPRPIAPSLAHTRLRAQGSGLLRAQGSGLLRAQGFTTPLRPQLDRQGPKAQAAHQSQASQPRHSGSCRQCFGNVSHREKWSVLD